MSNFLKVRKFHKAFGVEAPRQPAKVDQQALDLRMSLIAEEFAEVAEELGYSVDWWSPCRVTAEDVNLASLGKELADLLYVVYGTGITYGLDMDAIFAEVHASNMSKLGEDGKPVYREDGKVLKGPNYRLADVSSVIEGQFAGAV